MKKQVVLTPLQVDRKLQRIAREILETSYQEQEVILIGIKQRGVKIAKRIKTILETISSKIIIFHTIELNKNLQGGLPVFSDNFKEEVKHKHIVLVDDVINSGKTLIYAIKHLLDYDIKGLNTVVLVDRKHRKFPVRADFVGLTLSTTLKEHISVEEDGNRGLTVYLE